MYFTIENPDAKLVTELETAKAEAERANAAKTDFLTKVSHEVRTPLNAIVGFAATLDEVETLEEARENAQYIVSASKNILELVNGILDISKLEENKVEIVNTEYSLIKECEEIIHYIEPRLAGKPIIFKRTIARDIPKVLVGDKAKIKEIITNLLNNAIEYTKEGYIDLNISCINKENTTSLVISVEDSGVGISQKNVEKLFDKYSNFNDNLNSGDASGLELSITKSLVELLGGRIIVQTAQGAGTKFTVYLNQEIAAIQQLPETEIVVEEEVVEEVIDENAALDLTGKKILVVDDNNLNLKVAVNFIKEYGAEIDTCTSGNECVSFINEGKVYDIIFMDDMMPKVSGTETLHILQQIPSFNQKVIVLTANSIEGVRDKYLEAGFEDYLSKPIIKMELERVLRKHLNNKVQRVIFDPVPTSNEENSEQ
jgi:CheY-like chemotaxis protein